MFILVSVPVSRDRSFTATKGKETRILAQENTGMR